VSAEVESPTHYPVDVWEGTILHELALTCQRGNHLPLEFFIETAKTVIGAVCGHRITPATNLGQETRFYTTLLSEFTGGGKSESVKWLLDMMYDTQLLYTSEHPPLRELTNVGARKSSFGSGRGMIEAFFKHGRILQVYDEMTVMVEKFNIKGSGGAFMGVITEMFENHYPPESGIGGTGQRPDSAPRTCHNSILSCTIKKKREEMYSSGADNSGWWPRENLVATGEIELVSMLEPPDLSEFGAQLFNKIVPLNDYRVLVKYSAEARAMLDRWFLEFHQRTKEDADDVKGRLNVQAIRNASFLTWLLADGTGLETTDAKLGPVRYIECDADIMHRALRLAEYELAVRRANESVQGNNDWAKCENIICKHLAQATKQRLSKRMLVRKAHLSKYGITTVNRALMNLLGNHAIAIYDRATLVVGGRAVEIPDEDLVKSPDTIFLWTGDARSNDAGWTETRGRKRTRPYLQLPAGEPEPTKEEAGF
jgi:hypothetical protein